VANVAPANAQPTSRPTTSHLHVISQSYVSAVILRMGRNLLPGNAGNWPVDSAVREACGRLLQFSNANAKWRESCAMAQAVSRRPLTAYARVRSRVSPCGICGGQSGTGRGFSPQYFGLPSQFHSTGAPVHGKAKKTNHLHHRVAQ
jgi:hypothetical protein